MIVVARNDGRTGSLVSEVSLLRSHLSKIVGLLLPAVLANHVRYPGLRWPP